MDITYPFLALHVQDANVDWDDPFDLVARAEIEAYNKWLFELVEKYRDKRTPEELHRYYKMCVVLRNPNPY